MISMRDVEHSVATIALDSAARLIMNDRIWADAVAFCRDLMNSDLSKAERHAKVKRDLQFIIDTAEEEISVLGEAILDIAIKMAVLFLQQKAAKGAA